MVARKLLLARGPVIRGSGRGSVLFRGLVVGRRLVLFRGAVVGRGLVLFRGPVVGRGLVLAWDSVVL